MASSGIVFECLLVSQSFTIPGVYKTWQPMHAFVWGLNLGLSEGSIPSA